MKNKNLTTGKIIPLLLKLAWPNIIAFTLHTAYNLIDAIYVGRISAEAIAAVTMVFPIFFFMFALGSGIGVGVNAVASKYIGAKKVKDAEQVAMNSYLAAIIIGSLFSFLGLTFSKQIFSLIGARGTILNLVLSYSKWIFIGAFFMIVGMVSTNILRAEGDMKTPMKAMIVSVLINLILDPLLIFGIWIFPKLNVEGAAIATFISRFFSFLFVTYFVLSNKAKIKINIKKFKIKPKLLKEIFKVGFPSSLNQLLGSLALIIFTKLASFINYIAVATIGIVLRVDSMITMPCLAISVAVVTFVGHNIGAGKIKRAKSIAWNAVLISSAILEFLGILSFLFSKQIASAFTTNAELIYLVSRFFRIEGLFYGFAAFSIILSSAFQGAGYGIPAFFLNFIRIFIIMLPFSFYFVLVKNLGIVGVYISFPIGTVTSALIASLWFKKTKIFNSPNYLRNYRP